MWMEKEEIMSKEINENKKFARRKFKMGSFQTIIMIIVLVVVVLVNIVIARMNWSKDMNSDYLYTLSSDTVNYLKTLKDDVTIYYLVEDGHEAQTSTYTKTINIENSINRYDGLGTVRVEKKNPVLYPFLALYRAVLYAVRSLFGLRPRLSKIAPYVHSREEMFRALRLFEGACAGSRTRDERKKFPE